MVKSTRPVRVSAEDRVRQFLAEEDAVNRGEVAAQVEFWTRFRQLLAVNDASSGLEALDDLALSVLAGSDSTPLALSDTVLVLPSPDAMFAGQARAHDVFHDEVEESVKRPASRTRSQPRRSPPAKKQKLTRKKSKAVPSSTYSLDLPEDTLERIKRDVTRILREAAAQGLPPFRVSYPWADQRAWYDPKLFADLFLAQYRFWMRYCEVFFLCALYPPSDDSEYRRKQKANAIQARLEFVGLNIIVFGYFGFLERFELRSHETLMWLGGPPSKHSAKAKLLPPGAKTAEDLASLYKRDNSRYQRTVDRVLDPLQVDEAGYASIPELVEQSGALDPSQKPVARLSDEALTRVAFDAFSGTPTRPSWVGNTSTGVWKRLLANKRLHAIQARLRKEWAQGGYEFSFEEKPYSSSEKQDDDSDFEDEEGNPTVLPPSKPICRLAKPSATARSDTLLDEDEDEEKPPPPKKTSKPIALGSEGEEDDGNSDPEDGQDEDEEADASDSDATEDQAESAESKKSPPPKSKDTSTTSDSNSKTPSPDK